MVDKIVISNNSALNNKYGTQGLQAVQAGIAKLVAADLARGLQTTYVAVDDPTDMSTAGGVAVTNPQDPQQNKLAVDALYGFHKPQYLVLLGSLDVIPHQILTNPAYNPDPVNGDPDQTVPSDLPYACDGPFSQNISDFDGPERVVSRLPDITGTNDPAYLIHVLDIATNATTLTHSDYADYLGVSAAVWSQSTASSLNAIFGLSADMQSVPPASYQWPASLLSRRSHYFNCHGADLTPQYFGQIGTSYPVAHDASYVTGRLTSGTVASAECCYGAQLYDPVANPVPNQQMGIANVYMAGGAYGFWGSTTIAYGPADSNAQADLICQYFLERVLNGASLGEAALSARQTYVQNMSTVGPVDQKTLAQYILLGDASIHCVPSADPGVKAAPRFARVGITTEEVERLSRLWRRQRLAQSGSMLRATRAVAESSPSEPPQKIRAKLEQVRAAAGLQNPAYASYRVRPAPEPTVFGAKALTPQAGFPTAFHLLFEGRAITQLRIKALRIVEVTEADGEFIRVREFFSR
jgi:hypothetical protein